MSKEKPLIGIFIPCYNEEQKILEVINTVFKFLNIKSNFPYKFKIIVVDDGSTDNSYQLICGSVAHYRYRNLVNQGLGSATRTGMEIAHYLKCDVFVKFDADLQHRVEDILQCITPILNDQSDLVYGSRFMGKINYRMPLVRKIGNKVFTKLMRVLTGWDITDAQTGLMCFGRRYLSIFEMPSIYNPPQQALIDAKFKGMRYGEVSVEFEKRNSGKSFISIRYIPKVISSIMKLITIHYGYKLLLFYSLFASTIFLILLFSDYLKYINGLSIEFIQHGYALLVLMIIALICGIFGFFFFSVINRENIKRNSCNYLYFVTEFLEKNKD